MKFDLVINDFNLYELCGFALTPRFTPTGFRVSSISDSLKHRLRLFYERGKTSMKKPEANNPHI